MESELSVVGSQLSCINPFFYNRLSITSAPIGKKQMIFPSETFSRVKRPLPKIVDERTSLRMNIFYPHWITIHRRLRALFSRNARSLPRERMVLLSLWLRWRKPSSR